MTMKTYVVKTGDTLFAIAKSQNTTQTLILKYNPSITNPSLIIAGMELQIKTSAEERADQQKAIAVKKTTLKPKAKAVQNKRPAVKSAAPATSVSGKKITMSDLGTATILQAAPLLEFKAVTTSSLYAPVRMGIANTTFVVQGIVGMQVQQTVHFLGKTYAFRSVYALTNGLFLPVIDEYVKFATKSEAVLASLTPTNKNQLPAAKAITASTTEQFTLPDFVRPTLEFRRDDKLITLQMRLLSFTGTYSTNIQQTRTNAGWLLNMAGENLPIHNLNGFFIDSVAEQEFDKFMQVYNQYLTAYRDGDYYSSAICKFTNQGRQYQCLIMAFSYTHDSSMPLLRHFQMQLLILKETGPDVVTFNSTPTKIKDVSTYVNGSLVYLLKQPKLAGTGMG